MWTFDRYQRWMEQVQDWVRPTQAATPRVSAEGGLTQRAASYRQSAAPLPAAPLQPTPTAAKAGHAITGQTRSVQKKTGSAPSAPADDVFEVPAEDMDLAQLAELAKKVVERKP
jgi:hypothetical protein